MPHVAGLQDVVNGMNSYMAHQRRRTLAIFRGDHTAVNRADNAYTVALLANSFLVQLGVRSGIPPTFADILYQKAMAFAVSQDPTSANLGAHAAVLYDAIAMALLM